MGRPSGIDSGRTEVARDLCEVDPEHDCRRISRFDGSSRLFPVLDNAFPASDGLATVSGGIVECLQAPVFWILGVSLFVLFLAASRLQAQALRVIFFWTPAVSASAMSALLVVGYAWMRSRHG